MRFLDSQSARRIALEGAGYLCSATNAEGRFVYWRSKKPSPAGKASYNALRHFGAAWSMFEVSARCDGEGEIRAAAGLALDYGLRSFVKPFGSADMFCVVDGAKIKLGGAALAIVAIAAAERRSASDVAVATGLGRYILSQVNVDGTFVHSRAYPLGVQLPFVSGYYTGQSLMALLILSRLSGEGKWADLALSLLQRMSASPMARTENGHWMLYAIELAVGHGATGDVRRLGGRIAQRLIEQQGGPASGIDATSLSCAVEGLSAWLRIKRGFLSEAGEPDISVVQRQIRINLAAILKSRNDDGSFSSRPGEYDVRIDHVQHASAAFLAYWRQETGA